MVKCSTQRPTVIMKARKPSVRPMVQSTLVEPPAASVACAAASPTAWAASPPSPWGSRARTTAKPIQPTRSLSMAELITSMPMSDLARLRSMRILAITGRAVIDMAMPVKMANGS